MMNQAAHPEAEASASTFDHSLWRWPINPTRYDRTPELEASELASLVALDWNVCRDRSQATSRPEWGILERLLRPLDDARLSLFTPNTRHRRRNALDAVGLILYGCRMQQIGFWQWDEATRVEILGGDQRTFHQQVYPESSMPVFAPAWSRWCTCWTASLPSSCSDHSIALPWRRKSSARGWYTHNAGLLSPTGSGARCRRNRKRAISP
jgi:hypothetical protein